MCQELNSKEEEKVTEVNKVKVELQEQIGHLQAERTAQDGLREKIAALERQLKGDGLFHASQVVMLSLAYSGPGTELPLWVVTSASCLRIQPGIVPSILVCLQKFLSS